MAAVATHTCKHEWERRRPQKHLCIETLITQREVNVQTKITKQIFTMFIVFDKLL